MAKAPGPRNRPRPEWTRSAAQKLHDECGRPAKRPALQHAADSSVGKAAGGDDYSTYQLAMADLFRDHLGEGRQSAHPRHGPELLAGKAAAGGWTYTCPVMSDKTRGNLLGGAG